MTAATTSNPTTPDAERPEHAAPAVLFTAFEPSGDDHAAAVIAELRRRRPEVIVHAWGGPKMERAGARIVERTTDSAVMGIPGLAKIREHRRINRRIERWLIDHPVALHVPVDSPAANFPICAITRSAGLRVVHLVAPQMWAWGAWRVHKLRRLTDLVLCLLPFEESWFAERGVPAQFIGHPLFDQQLDLAMLDRVASGYGDGSPKLALLPGSRPGELQQSLPILLDAFKRVLADFPDARGVIAVTEHEIAARLRERAERLGGLPDRLLVVHGATDAAIRWCDAALVVSGTVTLQVARQCKPMATFYKPNPLQYTIGRFLISTKLFTLPNLIAGREIIPELIPYRGGTGEALAVEVIRLMRQPGYAEDQRKALEQVAGLFADRHASSSSAEMIELALGFEPNVPGGGPSPDIVTRRAPEGAPSR